MKKREFRLKEITSTEVLMSMLHKYAYLETTSFVAVYLIVGYIINPDDICLLDSDIPFLTILLAIVTLFHGFESGILTITLTSLAMMIFYDSFPYINFLVSLVLALIYSEFHYYWTQKIKKAEIDSNYKDVKLDEFSKAFYALKISHDQLENNYVVKPMSIRNALHNIISKNQELHNIEEIEDIKEIQKQNYKHFLDLVQKSFNVTSGLILYRDGIHDDNIFDEDSVNIIYGEYTEEVKLKEIFNSYIVDKAIDRRVPTFISDDKDEPSLNNQSESKYIAAIPAIYDDKVISVLVIEKMPFMSFERENLTSIAILVEFFTIEIRKTEIVKYDDYMLFIEDYIFRFELARLNTLYKNFGVNSILLVLKIDNELQALRMNEKIDMMLRSLDLSMYMENNQFYFISLLFPLHDKAAALGFLNRLISLLNDEDKEFLYMTFDLSKLYLFHEYINKIEEQN